jgi:hypothetical protein
MTAAPVPRPLRIDLHVHSIHSGFTGMMRAFRSRDCFSSPEAVYRAARARGMDLVTISDHNSIDGCLELLERRPDAPDILMGEEIECRLPGSGASLHVGAFGLTERHHRDVQPLRGNATEAAAFLRSEGVALVLHPCISFAAGWTSGPGPLLPLVHAVEVRRHDGGRAGRPGRRHRAGVERPPRRSTPRPDGRKRRHVAASPAPPGQGRTREEFLESLKRGESRASGVHGTAGRLAVEIYGVMVNYWAALIGFGSSGLTPAERARGIVGSLLLMPFQFTPMLVSIAQKRAERRRVAQWRRELRL